MLIKQPAFSSLLLARQLLIILLVMPASSAYPNLLQRHLVARSAARPCLIYYPTFAESSNLLHSFSSTLSARHVQPNDDLGRLSYSFLKSQQFSSGDTETRDSKNSAEISDSERGERVVKQTTDAGQDNPSDSTYWSLPPYLGRSIRKGAGRVASVLGFVASSSRALVSDRAHFGRMKEPVEAFQKFLNTSGIYLELSQSLNRHLLRDIIVLRRVQRILAARRDPRGMAKSKNDELILDELPSKEEAIRYMRYATAVYGNNMIIASEMDLKGKFDTRLSPLTHTRISEHIGLPEEDIVLVDVDYGGDNNHLRHFVAVDHVNKKVVLAIRGTFNLNEIIVDIAAFSRPCFGGEAHSEMYTMAERVWTSAGGTVMQLLKENDDYEFILTGHSLGAGCACLINIMCHRYRASLVGGRKVRCFAYAPPPVFKPLELIPEAVKSTTSYIMGRDVVPFLSVDSVRHVFSCVRAIEDYMATLSRTVRFQLTTGLAEPDEELVQAVLEASYKRLKPKQGAPVLAIPAAAAIWMVEQESGEFDYEICDPEILATLGITIDLKMVDDHLPSRYEHALENLKDYR